MGSLFTYAIDYGVADRVARFVGSRGFREFIAEAVQRLPELGAVSRVVERFGEPTAFKYLVYVAVNDWGLAGVYYRRGGEAYRGAEALWTAVEDALNETEAFDVESITRLVLSRVKGLRRRRADYFRRCANIVGSQRLEVLINGWVEDKVIEYEPLYKALRDEAGHLECRVPVGKAVGLILRTAYYVFASRGYRVKSHDSVIFDVHIAKVILRLGLIAARPRSGRFLPIGFPLSNNASLRSTVLEAWSVVSKRSGVPAWDIDAALWRVGREFRVFDDELPRRRIRGVSCPLEAVGDEPRCPLREVCESSRSERSGALGF